MTSLPKQSTRSSRANVAASDATKAGDLLSPKQRQLSGAALAAVAKVLVAAGLPAPRTSDWRTKRLGDRIAEFVMLVTDEHA